jgi:chemotaxis methyl-accepting protein methylase
MKRRGAPFGDGKEEAPASAVRPAAEPGFVGEGPPASPPGPVCVVGITAGSHRALEALVALLPAGTGMAFVLVAVGSSGRSERSHVNGAPGGAARAARPVPGLPMREAIHGELLEPDRAYVVPETAVATYAGGRIHLATREGHALPADVLLRSLALGARSRAACVILSGAGAHGALGVQAIKDGGGATFVEVAPGADPEGMPRAAIRTGAVDHPFSAARIAALLGNFAERLRAAAAVRVPAGGPDDADLTKILDLLRAAHGVDFTLYRRAGFVRRIVVRMTRAGAATLRDYLALLQQRPVEVDALYQDILVKVTHFFRDPGAFDALARLVLPALVDGRRADAPIRVWVPGCSTGEEVYSIAVALSEVIAARRPEARFQIFGTDVHGSALETARRGAYVEGIAMDVSADRLGRFFTPLGDRYQIARSIRDACIFARHDITRDPPFSRIDLVSCRNVLLYLDPMVRRHVLPFFHHALDPAGYLFVGASETLAGPPDLFSPVDAKHGLYARNASAQIRVGFSPADRPPAKARAGHGPCEAASGEAGPRTEDAARIAGLERDLGVARDRLRASAEEHEALIEELQSSNEELTSSNDELQSVNEELETSREELQAAHDELASQNALLGERVADLDRLSDELGGLLSSMGLAVVLVDRDLRVQRFTPEAGRLLGLRSTDTGRFLAALDLGIDVPDLEQLVSAAAGAAATSHEREVRDRTGRWYSMRIRPYRRGEGQAEGAVMVLVELGRPPSG